MSFKDYRKYAVVRLSGFRKQQFDAAKRQGLVTSGFDTMRVSLDGTMGIVSWNHRKRIPNIPSAMVVWEGDHAQMREYLKTNRASWEVVIPPPVEKVVRTFWNPSTETPRELPQGVTLEKPVSWKWWAAAAAVAGGAALYYLVG